MLTQGPEVMNVTSFEGTISLRCDGLGLPIPTITWYQNGSMIDADESNDTTVTSDTFSNRTVTSTLTIIMPMVNNSGNYHCNLSSTIEDYQEVMSEVVLVLVQGKPLPLINWSMLWWCRVSPSP